MKTTPKHETPEPSSKPAAKGRASDETQTSGTPASPTSGEDYRNASGRDHPAESEHDHKRQKLNGESAKMAEDPAPERRQDDEPRG